ncbi:MAG: hypothetical protein LBN26_04610 [Christensenellaceae bacterium]|jgi:hypothetical protein|nr:hypothetical protein [Christensenellaceae bacterium]
MDFTNTPLPPEETDPLAQMLASLITEEPAYAIGRQLIQCLCDEAGVEEAQAAALLLGGHAPGGAEALCARAASDLIALQAQGQLTDVDSYLADAAFVQLLYEMPAPAAVRLYHAERAAGEAAERERRIGGEDMLEKLRARRSLPLPVRTGTPGGAPADYASMSSSQFAQIKKRLEQAAAQGRRAPL